jgi:hypothetical protein
VKFPTGGKGALALKPASAPDEGCAPWRKRKAGKPKPGVKQIRCDSGADGIVRMKESVLNALTRALKRGRSALSHVVLIHD